MVKCLGKRVYTSSEAIDDAEPTPNRPHSW